MDFLSVLFRDKPAAYQPVHYDLALNRIGRGVERVNYGFIYMIASSWGSSGNRFDQCFL